MEVCRGVQRDAQRGVQRCVEVHGGVCRIVWRCTEGCTEVRGGVCGGMEIEDGSKKDSGIDGSFSVIAANGDTLNVCYFCWLIRVS